MPSKEPIVDLSTIDFSQVIADLAEIRRYNPQRYEMEQLTAIVFVTPDHRICVGYKDVGHDEFWIRGHMPGAPLMPGVLICEAAAQLGGYFLQKYDISGIKMLGFGAIEEVHFRGIVRPGDRLVIAVELLRCRRGAMSVCRFQAFVKNDLVAEGIIRGIPLPEQIWRATQPA